MEGAGSRWSMGLPFIDAQDFLGRLGVDYRITFFYYTLFEDAVQTLPVRYRAERVNMMLELNLDRRYQQRIRTYIYI